MCFQALVRSEDLSELDHEKCQVRVPTRHRIQPGQSSPKRAGRQKKTILKKEGKGSRLMRWAIAHIYISGALLTAAKIS